MKYFFDKKPQEMGIFDRALTEALQELGLHNEFYKFCTAHGSNTYTFAADALIPTFMGFASGAVEYLRSGCYPETALEPEDRKILETSAQILKMRFGNRLTIEKKVKEVVAKLEEVKQIPWV